MLLHDETCDVSNLGPFFFFLKGNLKIEALKPPLILSGLSLQNYFLMLPSVQTVKSGTPRHGCVCVCLFVDKHTYTNIWW